jgi:glucokinase
MTCDYKDDKRIVLTLDAGGTNFRFGATRGGKSCVDTVAMPARPEDLGACLGNIVQGFERARAACPEPPVAISFAFPGPADYPNGIIDNVGNLSCFRGGVPLGPLLSDAFGVPVFINNDGDLFTYGEAIGGFLPHVNGLLEKAGGLKRYNNLLGFTIGTGFGGGLVRNGELFLGDNSMSAEVWLMRDKLAPAMNIEESVSIRAVRRVYAECAGIAVETAPDPKGIEAIAKGAQPGNRDAAIEAYRRMGEAAGDAIANALTIADGLVVIGGGISAGAPLFLPALVAGLNGAYERPGGKTMRRLVQKSFEIETAAGLDAFLNGGDIRTVEVPRIPAGAAPRASEKHPPHRVTYDASARIAVGISRLGTSAAVALGAYVYALRELDAGKFPKKQ